MSIMTQVQQLISTAAGILPQAKGQAQLTEPHQAPPASKPGAAQWNVPVDTKRVCCAPGAHVCKHISTALHVLSG